MAQASETAAPHGAREPCGTWGSVLITPQGGQTSAAPWDRPLRPGFSGPERPPQEAGQPDGAAEGTSTSAHETLDRERLVRASPDVSATQRRSFTRLANFTRWQLRALTLPFLETLAAQREPVPRSVSVEAPGRCCPQVCGVPQSTGQEGVAGPFRARLCGRPAKPEEPGFEDKLPGAPFPAGRSGRDRTGSWAQRV